MQGRYKIGWAERFGFVRARYTDQPCIWIHAVSMGEINAMGTLVGRLQQVLPQFEIIISSTTDTGFARAKKLYGQDHRVFFYPWDFTWAVRRAFRRLHPQLCILMELEVWHNFTLEAKKRQIPVVVANGRISSGKGFPRYKKIAPLVRGMFGRLELVLAQDEEYADRFRFLGAAKEKVQVAGTLKYDTAEVVAKVAGTDELAGKLHFDREMVLWVAGSTGPGEEEIVLESFERLRQSEGLRGVRLAVVPRKPERFDEVGRLIESRGHKVLRYSKVKAGEYDVSGVDEGAVILGDTMGICGSFYSLASVILWAGRWCRWAGRI